MDVCVEDNVLEELLLLSQLGYEEADKPVNEDCLLFSRQAAKI